MKTRKFHRAGMVLTGVVPGLAGFWLGRMYGGPDEIAGSGRPGGTAVVPGAVSPKDGKVPGREQKEKDGAPAQRVRPKAPAGMIMVTEEELKSMYPISTMGNAIDGRVKLEPDFVKLFRLSAEDRQRLEEQLTRLTQECQRLDVVNRKVVSQTEKETVIAVAAYPEQANALWAALQAEMSEALGGARGRAMSQILVKDRDRLTLDFGQVEKRIKVHLAENGDVNIAMNAGSQSGGFSTHNMGSDTVNSVPRTLRHLIKIEEIRGK